MYLTHLGSPLLEAFLKDKNILVGITGGIAAYKCAELVRRLKDSGAHVRVIMTEGGKAFITPLTLQALSGNPVGDDLLDPSAEAAMGHIEYARWADLVIIAPASADFLSKLAVGAAPDLLSTLCLATTAPLCVAPAMNQVMWGQPATQDNLALLKKRKVHVLGPAAGEQACGDVGYGRMVEPMSIVESVAAVMAARGDENVQPNDAAILKGYHCVVTAGPTREALDPVRYLSNYSSGKMGYALAEAVVAMGGACTLISGPVSLPVPHGVTCVDIESAEDMLQAALTMADKADIFIGAAAVADFRPATKVAQKMKKTGGSDETMTLHLVKNPDVLATVANLPRSPFMVGFAAETQDIESYARKKLVKKQLDMIVANDVSQCDIGFNADENRVTVLDAETKTEFDKQDKLKLAFALMRHIALRVKK